MPLEERVEVLQHVCKGKTVAGEGVGVRGDGEVSKRKRESSRRELNYGRGYS